MTLSNFSQDISKAGWDRHIDNLVRNQRIVPSKKNTYLSLKKEITKLYARRYPC